jgi:hypothetical protein
MVHRPDERMFFKRAVILTNAIGSFQKGAQNDIVTSLRWLGITQDITRKTVKFAKKFKNPASPHKGFKVRGLFALCKFLHQ